MLVQSDKGPGLEKEQRKLRSIMRQVPSGPPALALVGVGLLCLLASLILADTLFRLGFLTSGLALLGLAGLTFRRSQLAETRSRTARRQQSVLKDAVSTVVGHDPDPAFLTDVDGNVHFANPAAKDQFGETAESDLSQILSQVLANPDGVLFRLQNRSMTVGAAKEDVVTRTGQFRLSVVKAGENSYLWRFEQTGTGARDTNRASDALSLPMMTVGPSNAVLYVNDAMRRFAGVRPKSVFDLFDKAPERSGERHRIPTSEGDIDVLVAIVQGIAGRREIFVMRDDENVEARDKLDLPKIKSSWAAIEDLPVPLMKIEASGAILDSNQEARSLFGLTTTEGKTLGEILDGLGRPVEQWLNDAMTGSDANMSQFLRSRGGTEETHVQVTLNRGRGENGAHLIAVINDVTELKTLEQHFVQSQKMQAIGQLAGGVAHDFNNLLTAISGHCDLLLLRHDQGDMNYGDLIQIHQNANRAASLVGQLLAYSRKQNLQPERVDLRHVLSELTHLLNRLVGERVTLSLRHDPDLADVRADKRQFEQVIMNLVVNARDAMPNGGEIVIATQNVTLDQDLNRNRATLSRGDYVVVKVIDKGVGIPADEMDKIFVPFHTTKRVGEGTGLGLSTAYGIVKQTGGYIFADSEVGKGTTFEIYLPAQNAKVADSLPAVVNRKEPVPLNGDGVVLLVEDEAPVRAFASRALRLRGYTVLEADSAEAALDLLNDPDLSVDIFVTDVIMPGKDGPTWVKEALIKRPDTKVVFVSGYAEDAFAEGKTEIPNSVFLPKPFSLNQLTTTVRSQLH